MATDWNNTEEILKKRQQAIDAGYKSTDVDAFIKQKKDEMATLNLLKGGIGDISKIAADNPQLAQKAVASGIKPTVELSADAEKKKAQQEKLAANLAVLQKNYDEAEHKGPIGGRLNMLNSLTGGSFAPQSADYEALRQGLIGQVARGISGETGVLNDQDIKRAENLLPKITDADSLTKNKIANLYQMLGLENPYKKGSSTQKKQASGKSKFTIEAVE